MTQSTLDYYRDAVAELLDSLDASMAISRVTPPDRAADEVQKDASRLVERLGKANRLSTSKFNVPERIQPKVVALTTAVQRLDEAFVSYRRMSGGSAEERERGAVSLQAEIDRVRASLKIGT